MKYFDVILEENSLKGHIMCEEGEIKKIASTPQNEDCVLKRGLVPKSKIIAVIESDYNGQVGELKDIFDGIELPAKKPEPYSGKSDIPAFTRRAPGQKPARWKEQDAPPLSAA